MRKTKLLPLVAVVCAAFAAGPAFAVPSVAILAPVGGFVGSSVTVVVSVTDIAAADIASVELLVDGSPAGSDADGVEPFEVTWSPAANGATYQLKARLTDTASATYESSAVSVTADLTAPSNSITTAPGATLRNVPRIQGVVQGDAITGLASDTGSGLQAVTVVISHAVLGLTDSGLAELDGAGGWSYIPAFALVPGDYSVSAVAFDAAGNSTGAASTVFIV